MDEENFDAKILSHYANIVIFMLGYFTLNHLVVCTRFIIIPVISISQ